MHFDPDYAVAAVMTDPDLASVSHRGTSSILREIEAQRRCVHLASDIDTRHRPEEICERAIIGHGELETDKWPVAAPQQAIRSGSVKKFADEVVIHFGRLEPER